MKKMEFIPKVSYVGNVFHFVSNLAQWHFSCRSGYKDFWLKEAGGLTNVEDAALEKARELFLKYTFGKNFWGKIFLREREEIVWAQAKENFGEDAGKFKEIFDIFEPRFQQFWKNDKNLLEQWGGRIKVINFLLTPPGLTEDLDIFFGNKTNSRTIEIFLLMNIPGNSAYGSSVIGPGAITLEISRTPFGFLRPVVLVTWHELIHNIWQDNNYWKLIEGFGREIKSPSPVKGISWQELINEAVTESLFSHGYLAQKYFGFPSQKYFAAELNSAESSKNSLNYWRDLSASKLFSIAEDYIENRKPLDIAFLQQIANYLKN